MRLLNAVIAAAFIATSAQAGIFTGLFGNLYRNPECSFEVWFPQSPQITHETVSLHGGATVPSTRYLVLRDYYVFTVTDTDYSSLPAIPDDAVEDFIAMLKPQGVVIASDESAQLDTISGRRITYVLPKGGEKVAVRFFAKRGHLFRIAEVMPKFAHSSQFADASWFEEKFKLIDGCNQKDR